MLNIVKLTSLRMVINLYYSLKKAGNLWKKFTKEHLGNL